MAERETELRQRATRLEQQEKRAAELLAQLEAEKASVLRREIAVRRAYQRNQPSSQRHRWCLRGVLCGRRQSWPAHKKRRQRCSGRGRLACRGGKRRFANAREWWQRPSGRWRRRRGGRRWRADRRRNLCRRARQPHRIRCVCAARTGPQPGPSQLSRLRKASQSRGLWRQRRGSGSQLRPSVCEMATPAISRVVPPQRVILPPMLTRRTTRSCGSVCRRSVSAPPLLIGKTSGPWSRPRHASVKPAAHTFAGMTWRPPVAA